MWTNPASVPPRQYVCGFCGNLVAPNAGYIHQHLQPWRIYICSGCDKPTFFEGEKQTPGVSYGNAVAALPADVGSLYSEIRSATSINAFTAAVLACRKLLMHIAVEKGAAADKPFIEYVEYLADAGYIPPDGKGWVDHIRKKGNEANHEIKLMSEADAKELVAFVEMLLKFVYEFTSKLPSGP